MIDDGSWIAYKPPTHGAALKCNIRDLPKYCTAEKAPVLRLPFVPSKKTLALVKVRAGGDRLLMWCQYGVDSGLVFLWQSEPKERSLLHPFIWITTLVAMSLSHSHSFNIVPQRRVQQKSWALDW